MAASYQLKLRGNIKIKYSKSDNLYYIKQDINRGAAAGFSSSEQTLEFQISVPKKQVSIKNEYIDSLLNEFKNFKAGDLKIIDEQPTAEDYITAIISQKVGACRHRAVAFKYLIDKNKAEKLLPPSIRTRVILNDCHAFVEVSEDSGITWSRHCLGGYPAELRKKSTLPEEQSDQPIIETSHYEMQDDLTSIDTMHDEPPFLEETLTSIEQILSETRDFNSFFKTWDTGDTSINNIKEYALNVITHTIGNSSEKGKNRLILTDSDNSTLTAINSLQNVAQSINKPFFYINSPDDLICSSPWLKRNPDDTGNIMSGPGGKLHDFLISTVGHHPIIIVNYSNFKPEDLVRLNSLLDEKRIADGTPVPDDAAIIGVYNSEQLNAYSGSDFYSRFNSGGVKKYPISKDKIDEYNAGTPHLKELKAENIDLAEYYIINLHESPLWETMLLGNWKIKNNELTFVEGELQTALNSSKPIVFLNPPKTKNFARFWLQALLTKKINVYGKTLNIEGLNLQVLSQYDFSLFRDLFITEKSMPSSLPCFVLNPSTFGRFIANVNVGSNGELETIPGIIESNEGHQLALHLTRELTKQNWSLLLTLCKRHSIKIHVTAAPTVEVPEEIKDLVKLQENLQPKDFDIFNKSQHRELKKVLVSSEDMDLTAMKLSEIYENPLVIDVSSYTASDLIQSIKGSLNKNTLKFDFHKKDCLVKKALRQGQTVILKGVFTDELKDEVASLFDSKFDGRLIIISDDVSGFCLNLDTFYKHTPTIAEKTQYIPDDKQHLFNDEQIASLTISQLQALLRHYDKDELDMARPWLGLSNLPVGATTPNELLSVEDFEQQRLAVIEEHLKKSPFVFIAGATGVGKSTFIEKVLKVQPNTNVFIGEESLLEWAKKPTNSSKKILFIDEANLTGRDWMEFDSLYRCPPYIVIDGEYIELTKSHKVIFAGNPVSYSADRTIPKLFEIHGNTVMFLPISETYIKEKILLPALESDELSEQTRAKIVDEILKIYKFVCSKSQDEILISARELQMIALIAIDKSDEVFNIARKILPDKLKHDFDKEFDVSSHEPIQLACEENILHPASEYLWTESRQELKSILYELIKLREFRQSKHANQTQKYGGLGGLIIEGEPGIGKSAAAIAALVERGFNKNEQFYYIPISAEPSEKIRMLREAFNKGAIVVLDEINSTLMLERELNAMLMGVDTNGKKPDKPGFMLIGTQNPITMAGRKATSPAIMRRTIKYNLPDMPAYEMTETIISRYKLDRILAHNLVSAFTKQYEYAKVNNKSPAPNFRDLLKHAENLSTPRSITQQNHQLQSTDTLMLYDRLSEINRNSSQYSDEKNNALLAIRRGDFSLQNASEILKNDRDVVLAAVRRNGLQLEFASDDLKNDKDIAIEAINNNQEAQNFISDNLASDRDVIDAIFCVENRPQPPAAKRRR